MKKLLTLLMAVLLVLGIAACSTSTPVEEPEENIKIAISVSTFKNPFFERFSEGAKEKAAEFGAEVIVKEADGVIETQLADLETLLAEDIDVLVINPLDSDAVSDLVKSAAQKGIKIISVYTGVNDAEVDCAFISGNEEGAQLAGEYLLSLVGEHADVAELVVTKDTIEGTERYIGFHHIADKELNVLTEIDADFSREMAKEAMEQILADYPDLKGVFAHNDLMALGALDAIGDRDIVVVGFDGVEDALEAVESGKMAGTIVQRGDLTGAAAVETAVALVNGEIVKNTIPIENELVSR